MAIVLGLDGGATKSVSMVADTSGNILCRIESGPSNYQNIGKEKAKESITKAINNAIKTSKVEADEIDLACFGLAGMDSEKNYEVLYNIIRDINIFREVLLLNDAEIGLAGATGCQSGIVVNAGTGAVAFGVNDSGEKRRAGGWGCLIGDEGSAYDVSRKALMAAAKAYDGRGRPTILLPMIIETLELNKFENIIELLYLKGMSTKAMASLAPLVFEAAQKGDIVSRDILEYAGKELGLSTLPVAKSLGLDEGQYPIVPIGSMFKPGFPLYESFVEVIKQNLPDSIITKPRFEPVVGAILLALKHFGIELNDHFLEQIETKICSILENSITIKV